MRVTFIRPDIGRLSDGAFRERGAMEPLELAILAALTPPDIECSMFDDRIEAIPFDVPTDLVGITVEVYTARRAFEIATEYRNRGIPVVLGGFHATLATEECLQYADAVVTGDAETVWPRVLNDVKLGQLRRQYKGETKVPQAGRLMPRREIFAGKSYLPITLVQFSRGCPYPCEFCAISTFFKRQHATRPIDDVIVEIERAGKKIVFFVDDNLIVNRKALKSLLRALIPMRIRWISQASIDMADDPELMDLMEASGCLGTVTGFESVDQGALAAMGKTPNLRGGWDQYSRQVETLRRHHFQTWAAFTIGHDFEDQKSVTDLYEFASQSRFAFAAFNILMPYPGTPLYSRLETENRLLWGGRWWVNPDYRFNHAAFKPKKMTPDELTETVWNCRRKWTSAGSIMSRIFDLKTHLNSPIRTALYLRYNWVHRQDARKKQGMLFGKEGADLRVAQ